MTQLIDRPARPLISQKTRRLALALLITLAVAPAVLAQPADIGRAPGKATRLSLWTTIGSAAVGGGLLWIGQSTDNEDLTTPGFVIGYFGLALGPSVGHSYAGKPGRGALGAGIRLLTGAASAMFIALDSYNNQDGCYIPAPTSYDYTQSGRSHFLRDFGIFLAGVTLFSAAYDIATAARSAREYNRGLEKDLVSADQSSASITLAPTYFPQTGSPGLLMSWKF